MKKSSEIYLPVDVWRPLLPWRGFPITFSKSFVEFARARRAILCCDHLKISLNSKCKYPYGNFRWSAIENIFPFWIWSCKNVVLLQVYIFMVHDISEQDSLASQYKITEIMFKMRGVPISAVMFKVARPNSQMRVSWREVWVLDLNSRGWECRHLIGWGRQMQPMGRREMTTRCLQLRINWIKRNILDAVGII